MNTKKVILGMLGALALTSCSEDFLTKKEKRNISPDQIQDLIATNPELGLSFPTFLEAGNYLYMNSFDTAELANPIHEDFGQKAIDLGLDLMSNDMVQASLHWFGFHYDYRARLQTSRTLVVWKFYYKQIDNMNGILESLPDTQDQSTLYLKARCRAIRGFAYFNLIRIYANGEKGIPLYLDGYRNDSRVATTEIYNKIEEDLLYAYNNLDGYTQTEKSRINKKIAAGLLSRFYLQKENYALAAQYANEAKSGGQLYNATQIMQGFSNIADVEWMWGADITTATSTSYASFFSHIDNLAPGYAGQLQVYKSVDKRLYDAISDTDVRKQWFAAASNTYGLPQYANVKFVDSSDEFLGDYVYMRTAEMYLNEAEALSYTDENAAREVLYNLVVTRDPNYTLSTNTGDALKEEIRKHRAIELWGEGFAFFDMKRWNIPLYRSYPGTNHADFGILDYPAGSHKFNFQLPQSEMDRNFEITEQNPQ